MNGLSGLIPWIEGIALRVSQDIALLESHEIALLMPTVLDLLQALVSMHQTSRAGARPKSLGYSAKIRFLFFRRPHMFCISVKYPRGFVHWCSSSGDGMGANIPREFLHRCSLDCGIFDNHGRFPRDSTVKAAPV